ncbi:MAG: terpene cyclase/mutase family protein [Planctomycetes bacterium]|nr:terpene cyclase/mutase family protein [Planctomycetota bacterium]
MRRLSIIIIGLLFTCALSFGEDPGQPKIAKPGAKKPDDPVNIAIDKGVAYLMGKTITGGSRESELVALTLIHCEIKSNDPKLKDLIDKVAAKSLSQTYNVAVKAMVLEAYDRVKYQSLIAECAQALVNHQSVEGLWGYAAVYKKDKDITPTKTKGTPGAIEVITDKDGAKMKDTKPLSGGYEVKRNNPKRPSGGDNSNTQFALLGLRSAARAGVTIPKETWLDAVKWLKGVQVGDGGWSYVNPNEGPSYGSMTCAGICGLAIALCYSEQDFQNDGSIQRGLNWLGNNLKYANNPGASNSIMKGFGPGDLVWHYYFVYGIERVGAVLGLEEISGHNWYKEGAEYLVGAQSAKDGSWNTTNDDAHSSIIADTCFALLFLKKATPKLELKAVITGKEETPPSAPEEKK